VSVDVPVLAIFDLTDRLHAAAQAGHEAAARLAPVPALGELSWVIESFLSCMRLAARGAAAETDLLGTAVAGVAESWLALDGALVSRRQQVLAR
jgi:hypothetical protein